MVGGERSPNPNQAASPERVAAEAIAAARAGAAAVHLHAVAAGGGFSQDAGLYRELVAAVRDGAPDILVNVTTGGSTGMGEEERLGSLDCAPDLASLDCGSMNFGDGVFLNPPGFLERAAGEMARRGILPELECFDRGHVEAASGLAERGLVRRPPLLQLVLGVRGGAPATVESLCHLVQALPRDARWSCAAVGRAHFRIMAVALALGGHVRTGMEDVARAAPGEWVRSNAELVERAVALARALGREPATPQEARALLAVR